MNELSKNFEPLNFEEKWTKIWETGKYFESTPNDKPAYTVVIPPPNVTGVLHMGHTLNETVQDILVRHARMTGYNACWVPGSDHASIATEAKVVQMLKEKGIDKNNLTREEFLKYAFEWKDKYGGIIYNQIKRLGCSVDWSRVSFTMDDHYYKAVLKTFTEFYEKGLIYRGARMINWDVAAKTALSDEEVEFKDITGKLYHIKYKIISDNINEPETYIIVATQRPETIMGDTAVCFNPNDERYKHLKGKHVLIPLLNKKIPIIFDEYVDPNFGTGCLKVTPAHDINDYNLGLKHSLEIIDTLNDDGTVAEVAKIFVGEERFAVRKKIIEKLTEENLFIKEEAYPSRLGYSQRTGVVVEPKISTQWFLKMAELAKPALDVVVNGDIKIHPGDRFMATYKNWLENVKDWCISRQLWWGQQIPAWYDTDGKLFVAESKEKLFEKYPELIGKKIIQDEDVLDTWFSSWLWPIEVFNGISDENSKDFEYYYPTATLVTGQDIIFFWVARMIMAGLYFKKEIPFKDVYFTGMVRDKQGRKMSKQLGNSPDLLNLIDTYGADAVRFGIMISSPAGNDLLFDDGSLEQGKFFNNKIWNVLKLILLWEQKTSDKAETREAVIAFMNNKINAVQTEVKELIAQFKLSEALKIIYSLIWNDFCSGYLEWVKPAQDETINKNVYNKTIGFLETLMQLLHPFMPFITEEICSNIRKSDEPLCISQFNFNYKIDKNIIADGNFAQACITAIRDIKNKNQILPKTEIELFITTNNQLKYENWKDVICKQTKATSLQFVTEVPINAITIILDTDKIYLTTEQKADPETLKKNLEKDLTYYQRFLNSVEKKLSNEKFVANAKQEIIDLERKKMDDTKNKINAIEESLKLLNV